MVNQRKRILPWLLLLVPLILGLTFAGLKLAPKFASHGSVATAAEPREKESPQESKTKKLTVETSSLSPTFTNWHRVTSEPEELIIDFGIDSGDRQPDEPIRLTTRLFMNYYTTKRMAGAFDFGVQRHESFFGELSVDRIQKNSEKPKPPEAGTGSRTLDRSALSIVYANWYRVTGTPEELLVDLGLNTQMGEEQTEPVKLTHRLVMSFVTAKRLAQALRSSLSRYEQEFGVFV
jgi:hypothetical protein